MSLQDELRGDIERVEKEARQAVADEVAAALQEGREPAAWARAYLESLGEAQRQARTDQRHTHEFPTRDEDGNAKTHQDHIEELKDTREPATTYTPAEFLTVGADQAFEGLDDLHTIRRVLGDAGVKGFDDRHPAACGPVFALYAWTVTRLADEKIAAQLDRPPNIPPARWIAATTQRAAAQRLKSALEHYNTQRQRVGLPPAGRGQFEKDLNKAEGIVRNYRRTGRLPKH